MAVKGTGPSAWITVTATDRLSHALIWVNYAERINRRTAVTVRAITDRDWLLAAPGRLTLTQLLAPGGPPLVQTQFQPDWWQCSDGQGGRGKARSAKSKRGPPPRG